jgi:hypothetical protein
MITWDSNLISAIARRRSVIVIGSGVSKNSTNNSGKRPATWEDFLNNINIKNGNKKYIRDKIKEKDFLTSCELIKNLIGDQIFKSEVESEYSRPGYKHATIHEHIYNLDSSIVVSPNFDNIYDTYASSISSGTIIIRDHTSPDIINFLSGGDNRLLIKSHGSANSNGGIIFTRKEYAQARTKYTLFYETLKSLVLTHTFIFIGCGVDDPDIRMLFEDVQFAHTRMPTHYMTIPQGEVHDEILKICSESMNIQFLKYSPKNYHLDLTQSLQNLVIEVDNYRNDLAANRKW